MPSTNRIEDMLKAARQAAEDKIAREKKRLAQIEAKERQLVREQALTRQLGLGKLADQCGHSAIPAPTLEKLYRRLMEAWEAGQSDGEDTSASSSDPLRFLGRNPEETE